MLLNVRNEFTFLTAPDFFTNEIFLINDIFLYQLKTRLKTSLEEYFLRHNPYISTDLLNKQKQPFVDVFQNRYS